MNLSLPSLLLTFLPLAWSSSAPPPACPELSMGETLADCPWAGIARRLLSVATEGGAVGAELRSASPELLSRIGVDAKISAWKTLWAQSSNYDELARDTIVNPMILRELEKAFGLPESDGKLVHAGLEHTYGYLFSVLKTPFGYKRARWVQGEIGAGFGLPEGMIGPLPKKGTLFSNLTYFAGRIAFRSDPAALKTIRARDKQVPRELKELPYTKLKLTRLEEKVDGQPVTLRTDFVEFPAGAASSGNSHLLIYSVVTGATAKLVTVFPVTAAFVETALRPEALGERQPIVTRYNAHVPGVTGKAQTGIRRISS